METEITNGASVGATEELSEQSLIEVVYQCSRSKCADKQTINFFSMEEILPVTCCVRCRAGFGTDLHEMLLQHIGMFPISRAVVSR